MRRIYESEALRRDDDDPFAPGEVDEREYRSVNWRKASHAFMPTALRSRAIDVSVETEKSVYARDEPVRFAVQFRNRLPVPVSLRTTSPVRWTWALDGLTEASRLPATAPEEPALFEFARSERKTFSRYWPQRFRESEREWSTAEPGEHTLSVSINAASGAERLRDSTTFRID